MLLTGTPALNRPEEVLFRLKYVTFSSYGPHDDVYIMDCATVSCLSLSLSMPVFCQNS